MIFWLVFSVSIQLLLGIIVADLLWRPAGSSRASAFIKISLGMGLGQGLTSAGIFVWLVLFGAPRQAFFWAESLLFVLIFSFWCFVKIYRPRLHPREAAALIKPKSTISLILGCAFGGSLFCAMVSFVTTLLHGPHGAYDAQAIWNLRAKFIFGGGDNWTPAFSNILVWSHPDYPLLVPLNVVRYWEYISNENMIAPVVVAAVFFLALIGLLVSSLSFFRGPSQGWLAGLVVLSVPFFTQLGAFEYADTPLSFFLLGTLVFFTLQARRLDKNVGCLVLAGMCVGFAAWTKNEGALMLVSFVAAWTIVTIFCKGLRDYLRQLPFFLIGFVPVLLIIACFKFQMAPLNDLVYSQGQEPGQKLMDLSRYITILKALLDQITGFDPWYFNPLYFLLLYPLFLGFRIVKKDKIAIIVSAATLILISIGYFYVYLTTPNDLKWHLGTSLTRLIMQVFPSFVFLYFMVLRPPECEEGNGTLIEPEAEHH